MSVRKVCVAEVNPQQFDTMDETDGCSQSHIETVSAVNPMFADLDDDDDELGVELGDDIGTTHVGHPGELELMEIDDALSILDIEDEIVEDLIFESSDEYANSEVLVENITDEDLIFEEEDDVGECIDSESRVEKDMADDIEGNVTAVTDIFDNSQIDITVIVDTESEAEIVHEDQEETQEDRERKEVIALLPSTAAGGPRSLRSVASVDDALRQWSQSVHHASQVEGNIEVGGGGPCEFEEVGDKHGAPMRERKEKRHKRRAAAKGLSRWRIWWYDLAMWWKLLKEDLEDRMAHVRLWKSALKQIEGDFGNGVVSYFVFIRFLLLLNFVIFGIQLFLIVPQVLINYNILTDVYNYTNFTRPLPPPDYITNKSKSDILMDFFTGQGWINTTIMFYSNYHGAVVVGKERLMYNMPLAYLTVGGSFMLFSFVVMMWNFSETFTDNVAGNHHLYHSYCNKVFAAWDHCITSEKAAKLNTELIYHGFEADFEEEKRMEDRERRTWRDKARIYSIRFFSNLFCLLLLLGATLAIYVTAKKSIDSSDISPGKELTLSNLEAMLTRWASPLCISGLNMILPSLFQRITMLENHSPSTEIAWSLFRSVLLKVASLVVLIVSMYEQSRQQDCNYCWENKVAAQMFNLILVDCILICVVTITMETGRKYADRYLNFASCQLGKSIGRAQFQIPKNILELVYGQSLIWLGTFFAPMMPALGILKLILVFYVKKTSLMFNCVSSSKSFQGARSNYWFTLLLMLIFLLCSLTISYSAAHMTTSTCGPFRNNLHHCTERHMMDIIPETINHLPRQVVFVKRLFENMQTAVFLVPLSLCMVLVIYYYHSMTVAHEKMIALLEDELGIRGKDKQFLINKRLETSRIIAAMNSGVPHAQVHFDHTVN